MPSTILHKEVKLVTSCLYIDASIYNEFKLKELTDARTVHGSFNVVNGKLGMYDN